MENENQSKVGYACALHVQRSRKPKKLWATILLLIPILPIPILLFLLLALLFVWTQL